MSSRLSRATHWRVEDRALVVPLLSLVAGIGGVVVPPLLFLLARALGGRVPSGSSASSAAGPVSPIYDLVLSTGIFTPCVAASAAIFFGLVGLVAMRDRSGLPDRIVTRGKRLSYAGLGFGTLIGAGYLVGCAMLFMDIARHPGVGW